MHKTFPIALTLLLSACYNPSNFSFSLPVTNNTSVTAIACQDWDKIGEDIVKSTCHFDNQNSAETRPLVLRALDADGNELGNAYIGKATIGEKVRLNKAMTMTSMVKPDKIILDAID